MQVTCCRTYGCLHWFIYSHLFRSLFSFLFPEGNRLKCLFRTTRSYNRIYCAVLAHHTHIVYFPLAQKLKESAYCIFEALTLTAVSVTRCGCGAMLHHPSDDEEAHALQKSIDEHRQAFGILCCRWNTEDTTEHFRSRKCPLNWGWTKNVEASLRHRRWSHSVPVSVTETLSEPVVQHSIAAATLPALPRYDFVIVDEVSNVSLAVSDSRE